MKRYLKVLLMLVLPMSLVGCKNSKNEIGASTYSISLNTESITLEVNDTYALVAKPLDKEGKELSNKECIFHSSNGGVCKIDNTGLITALKPGRSTVTVISDTQIARCYVNVGGVEPESLISFKFASSSVSIKVGGYYTPSIITTPMGLIGIDYNYFVEDETIAEVEDGKIIGKAVGKTKVTASYGSLSDSIDIEVIENSNPEFAIMLNRANVSLKVGSTYQLEATCSEEATITWDSENSGIASVDKNGLVSANAKGSTTITATANGETATCIVNVSDGEVPSGETDIQYIFYIDYNNIDEPYMVIDWYDQVPLGNANKPANPTTPPDPAFPRFVGWSSHTIIDDEKDLWDFENNANKVGSYTFILYGIWFD